jgi:hypothetical protein
MYLSTIAISEFQVKQDIGDLPLRNFIVLPFNIEHAIRCGSLFSDVARDAQDNRTAFKDDMKLIAQCDVDGITHLITEDENTLVKYLRRLHQGVFKPTQAVLLKSGFDTAWFDGGQTGIAEQ